MKELTFAEKYDLLRSWSKSLANQVQSTLPEIEWALNPATKLPKGCPSHGSLALMAFKRIEEAVEEVVASAKMVREDISNPRSHPN